MNNTFANTINKLEYVVNNMDLSNINMKIINANVKKLHQTYLEIKDIWDNFDSSKIEYNIFGPDNSNYSDILSIIKTNFLYKNKVIKRVIKKSKFIHSLSMPNAKFYWVSNDKQKDLNSPDYILAINMFKIANCLGKYKFGNTFGNFNDSTHTMRIIIWIPTDKERIFSFNRITKQSLKATEEEFEAFVASGVTFGTEPRITIITRYEEVEKLLLHELIHNYYMDGSNYHERLKDVISEYKKNKNDTLTQEKNYDYEFSIYEPYTELLSTYFYLIFEIIKSGFDGWKNIVDKLQAQILVELIYSNQTICNLVRLNGFDSWNDFIQAQLFRGNICAYEYYYIKGLMYDGMILEFGNSFNDYAKIYENITKMIINTKSSRLLENIYNLEERQTQTNFKYQIH